MLEIFTVNINDALMNYDLCDNLNGLNYYGAGKHRNYLKQKDLYRSVIGEILVRTYLCKKINCINSQLRFQKNEYGKPYLSGNNEIFFSISHSGDWVCGAFSNQEAGVDIEEIDSKNIDIAKRFFCQSECDYIYHSNSNERTIRFHQMWTMKESFIKAKGKGLSILLNSFEIKRDVNSSCWYTIDEQNNKYFMQNHLYDQNYMVSVATPGPFEVFTIANIKYEELMGAFQHYQNNNNDK